MNIISKIRQMGKRWSIWRARNSNDGEMYVSSALHNNYGYTNGGILPSLINQLAIDAARIPVHHVRRNADGGYTKIVSSGLHNALTVRANIDQPSQEFMQRIYETLLRDGEVAIIPTEFIGDPTKNSAYDYKAFRTGVVKDRYTLYVRVELYNQSTGQYEEITLPKNVVAVVRNPYYQIMNGSGSIAQRLRRKIADLDAMDTKAANPGLDLLIQLPYPVRHPDRRALAEHRIKDIQHQLHDTPYGIAYIGAAEKVHQLNRPVKNTLQEHIDSLRSELHQRLGISDAVYDHTADADQLHVYAKRTLGPLVEAVAGTMSATFITHTGRTQGQDIIAVYNPFYYSSIATLSLSAQQLKDVVPPAEFRNILSLPAKTTTDQTAVDTDQD